jgi:hypothetical protein
MNIFEKRQRIGVVRKIVAIRWLVAVVMLSLYLLLKTDIIAGWAQEFDYVKVGGMMILAFGYNFVYWLFIRRPPEKISDFGLKIISACQVVVDQLMYTLLLHLTGSFETSVFLLYYITILIASSLYGAKGIILSGLLSAVLYDGTLTAEYYGIIPHLDAYPGIVWVNNPYMARARIMSFTFYIVVAVAYSIALSGLFRKRERVLQEQRDKLNVQTQQLKSSKDELQSALVRSDVARKAASKARDEMEKANVELKEKVGELERFYRITVGREVKMAEMKSEIKKLKELAKKAPKNS